MNKRDIQQALEVIQDAAKGMPSIEIVIGSEFIGVLCAGEDVEYYVESGSDLVRLINAIKTIDEFKL